MATPPNPRVYLADDFSWAAGGETALLNYYAVVDLSGGGILPGMGRGSPPGYALSASVNHGGVFWQIVDLDTGVAISSPTCGMAFGHNLNGLALGNQPQICNFGEAGGPTHVSFWLNAAHNIVAENGDGTILGTSTYVFPHSAADGSGPTYDFEAIVTVHGSDGTVQVTVDDVLVLDLSGKDTRNGGTGVINYVETYFNSGRYLSELRVHDGTAFLGSQWRVGYVPVAVAGTYANGTPTGADTILHAVDDDPTDAETEDATYLSLDNTSLPKKVSFGSGPMPASAVSIRDVFPQVILKKSDSGVNTGKIGLKSGATEVYNASSQSVPDGWVARRLALRTDPAAGTPLWTAITAEASEIIFERET